MKDKEPSSLKAISQAARPYPTTPRPPPQSSKSGPKYFPPDVIQEEDLESAMDLIPYQPDPPSPPSPPSPQSPPDTPTPMGQVNRAHPSQPDLLIYKEFKVTAQNSSIGTPPNDGLANSIHAPCSQPVDQAMKDLLSPTSTHAPTPEEKDILAHLALANLNRAALGQSSANQTSTLPQFTPTPVGGFPTVHMSHAAQIFDHLDNRVLLAWFQVPHPKFMIRVFDHSGKDVTERAAIIAERIRANVTAIAESIHHDIPPIRVSPPQPQGGKDAKSFPLGFLVHNVSEETKTLLLNQRIWSTVDLTFEALSFNCAHPPELLFSLAGFTTLDLATISQAVTETWNQEETRYRIESFFSTCGLPDDEPIYKVTQDFISSCRVELLDFKISGGLSVPRYNVFATSPTNDAKTWTDLRMYLKTLTYPTSLDGCGTSSALFDCQLCHSLAHPRGLCPFPLVPLWNGPKAGSRNSNNTSRPTGRTRGGKPGRST
ncbi:hypothetical protein P692DRAFT_20250481 [Suillus brevipes Sb2]|nr:hypothetical protein P692DRAFT_20250481 [Suillus brevipes Sb2]